MKKILLYSDSAEFGGHEVLSVKMANALAGTCDVVFLFHHERIGRELSASVKQERIPFRTQQGRLAFLRASVMKLFLSCDQEPRHV